MKSKLLRCGCAPNCKIFKNNKWVDSCTHGMTEYMIINLNGRKARCMHCNEIKVSDVSLAFFKYRPNLQYDEFYCGCRGWD